MLLATHSRAVYVDEGFYSDAAQNFYKFGQFGLPFDFPHWFGSPFLTFVESIVFSLFGPSLTTARMLAVVMSLIACLSFYAIVRMSLSPIEALLLTLSGLVTFNFVAHARTAFADPTAVGVSLLALLVYARFRLSSMAIPLSIVLGFLAFLSKVYFLFTFFALTVLWCGELLLVPLLNKKKLEWGKIMLLAASVLSMCIFFIGYLYVFQERIQNFYSQNTDKMPNMDPLYLAASVIFSLGDLPYNTKTQVYLGAITLSALAVVFLLVFSRRRTLVLDGIKSWGRAEYALGVWLLSGLSVIGILQFNKPHYHFFSILPLAFLGVVLFRLVFPKRLHLFAVCGVAVLHILFQIPYYQSWAARGDKTKTWDASHEIVEIIHEESPDDAIPVIGEYSSQLGLYSRRIFSLDAKWSYAYRFCDRLAYWHPQYLVNIVWPNSPSMKEQTTIENCEFVTKVEKIKDFKVFRYNRLALSRIQYREGMDRVTRIQLTRPFEAE